MFLAFTLLSPSVYRNTQYFVTFPFLLSHIPFLLFLQHFSDALLLLSGSVQNAHQKRGLDLLLTAKLCLICTGPMDFKDWRTVCAIRSERNGDSQNLEIFAWLAVWRKGLSLFGF